MDKLTDISNYIRRKELERQYADSVLIKAADDGKDYGTGKRMETVTVTRNGKTFQRKQKVGREKDDPKKDKQAAPEEEKKGKPRAGVKHITDHAAETDDEKLIRYARSGTDERLKKMAIAELRNRGHNIDNQGNIREKKKATSGKAAAWFRELAAEYKIRGIIPEGVDKSTVRMNFENPHESAIIKFKDQDGKEVSLYTEEFHKRSAEVKYSRIMRLGEGFLSDVQEKSSAMIGDSDPKRNQIGVVLSIISQTGLRVGTKASKGETGNEGITTLSAGSITVKGDEISLDFIGKSNKRNIAFIKDKKLAQAVSQLVEGKAISDPVFDVNDSDIINTLRGDFGYPEDVKTKDLRTVTAMKLARESLFGQTPPLPMPEDRKKADKLIASRLRSCFEGVAAKLNNTPAMAKNSYVPPQIIEAWMTAIGADNMLTKAVTEDSRSEIKGIPSLDEIAEMVPPVDLANPDKYELDDEIDGDYPMESWIEDLFAEYEPDYGMNPDEDVEADDEDDQIDGGKNNKTKKENNGGKDPETKE